MTDDDYDALSQKQLASIKRDMRISLEDAAVRATYKVMAELAQPEQEPVGQLLEDAFGRGQVMWFNKPKDESMLYTTPPQRTWVDLNTNQILDIYQEVLKEWRGGSMPDGQIAFAKAIEQALKERNT